MKSSGVDATFFRTSRLLNGEGRVSCLFNTESLVAPVSALVSLINSDVERDSILKYLFKLRARELRRVNRARGISPRARGGHVPARWDTRTKGGRSTLRETRTIEKFKLPSRSLGGFHRNSTPVYRCRRLYWPPFVLAIQRRARGKTRRSQN